MHCAARWTEQLTRSNPKAPPFVVGGFVGSKSVEHKGHTPSNYYYNLGHIVGILISSIEFRTRQNQPRTTKTVKPAVEMPSLQHEPVVEPEPQVLRNKSEKRSVSESSDDDDDAEVSAPTTPSWLRDMIVRVGSSDEDESSSDDWDAASDDDDWRSEDGEVVDAGRWRRDAAADDALSPIPTPTSAATPSTTDAAAAEYDSDDSDDGEWFTCHRQDVDEDDAKEVAAHERLADANRRWESGLAVDETDAPRRPVALKQPLRTVTFSPRLERVRPLVAWSFASRAARRGDWERVGRDAARFRERIAAAQTVLGPVLEPAHRRAVAHRFHAAADDDGAVPSN